VLCWITLDHGVISLQNYGGTTPTYDGNAYTYSSTYQDGTLKLYAHHIAAPITPGGLPEYHMTKLRGFDMTDSRETFVEGATAFRNARELAQRHRDSFIQIANAKASRGTVQDDVTNMPQNGQSDPGVVSHDTAESRQQMADTGTTHLDRNETLIASHYLYTEEDSQDPGQQSPVPACDDLSTSFASSFTSILSDNPTPLKHPKHPLSPPSKSTGQHRSKSRTRPGTTLRTAGSPTRPARSEQVNASEIDRAKTSMREEKIHCVKSVGLGVQTRLKAAVLGPGEGWNACIHHNGRLLKSPWSVRLQSDPFLVSTRSASLALPRRSTSVSFSTAARYICDYASYHGVGDQSRAAFAAALLLPASHGTMKQVHLPPPRLRSQPQSTPRATPDIPPWGSDIRQLDKLLTLSCNTKGIMSLLSCSFIESDIPCNVCGAWMQGTFAVLGLEPVKEPHIMAHILMNRGILVGIQHYVMRWPRPVAFKIDLHAAAWTETPVSFVQEPVSNLAPCVPFGPFGTIATKDCILEVQLHSHCPAHHGLKYTDWVWNCRNSTQVTQGPTAASVTATERIEGDDGEASGSEIPVQYDNLDREKDCSGSVTRNMFMWLRGTDVFPTSERAIYEHEWIDGWSSDDESVSSEGDGKSTVERRIGPWISHMVTNRSNTL
ncbi:Uncharacterized protein TPAR_00623, partial [Tolypocladium paradoxum]